MSVASKVIVAGQVMDVQTRGGVSAKTGETWSTTRVLIFGGDGVVAEVSYRGENSSAVPALGATITALVEVGVYRDDDSLDFVKYIELAARKAA